MSGVEPRRIELDPILENAHEAFISIGSDGRVVAWNREAERTFGWSREAVLGRPLRDLIIPERYRSRHDQGLKRFLETGEGPLLGQRIEITALHRSGHEFPVELTIAALSDDAGGWRFHAFVHDISDRYRAQELQARLATIVEHTADAVVTRTPDGVITTWNPAAERLFGYPAEAMIGRTIERIIPPHRAGESEELIARVLAGGALQGLETERVRADGTQIDVSITISPIRDDAGRVSELSMIVRDVTERRRGERALAEAFERLKETAELRSRFAAIASHELRTPVTSIAGFASTLIAQWGQLPEEERLAFVRVIEEQARRLIRLVDDVLVLSKVEAGRVVPERVEVDVAALAREVAEELGEPDVEVAVEDATSGVVVADLEHVRRILVNLLTNASRYGAAPVSVSVDGDAEAVEIAVADNGPGVPEHFVPHLFESFAQASGSASDGTGLGLAIVRALAEAAGGHVAYVPNRPRGARFAVRLPRP